MSRSPFLPFTTVNAATTTGVGAVRDLEGVYSTHTIAATATGSPSQWRVDLQGSHDGINWYSAGVSAGSGNGPTATATTHLWRYVRADFSVLTGGSAPTVTATIASA